MSLKGRTTLGELSAGQFTTSDIAKERQVSTNALGRFDNYPLSTARIVPQSKRASKDRQRVDSTPLEFMAKALLRKDGKRKGRLESAINKGDKLSR